MRLLLIEDDPTLSKGISEALKTENIHVLAIYDGLLAEKKLKRERFDCIILDVNLPGKNGFDICRDFRKNNIATPVLMLTAFGELEDKIQGFQCGADDYLTKPFFMRELVARIHSLISRHKQITSGTVYAAELTYDDIVVNLSSKKVHRQGVEVILTAREFQILVKLLKIPGEIISKSELIKEIWGTSFDVNTNTIEVYINFLRNKLDKPFGKQSIKTKIGFGYYLAI